MKIRVSGKSISKHPLTLERRELKPERFIEKEYRSGRERHTQKRYIPAAVNYSLETRSRWKSPVARARTPESRPRRSPSTLQLNRSNVKRKPSARGRTR